MGLEVIAIRNRILSGIDHRLRDLFRVCIAAHRTRFPRGRETPRDHRMTWLGPGLLFDPRTGRIQAL